MPLTTLLFWQQTASAEQELPDATPMTEMGEQSSPTSTSTPWTTMPRRPSSFAAAGEPAVWTLWQHWTGAVVQLEAGSFGIGVAAARMAREARAKSLEYIVSVCVLNDWVVFD